MPSGWEKAPDYGDGGRPDGWNVVIAVIAAVGLAAFLGLLLI